MSLQVWMPLNGNLDNQGLSEINFSSNYSPSYADGKIGKCMNGGTTISFSPSSTITTAGVSISMWVKSKEVSSSSTVWWKIATIRYTNNTSHNIYTADSENGRYKLEYSPSLNIYCNTQIWHHIVFTLEGSVLSGYLDGIKIGSSNEANDTRTVKSIDVGGNSNVWICDFRVYDTCISPYEIKQISQGLVLHYPLSSIVEIQNLNNVYQYPTFDTSSSNGGWNHWGASGSSGTYSQNTSKNYIFRSSQTYSHIISNSAIATGNYLLYQEVPFSGGYRCMQAVIKESNGLPITDSICFPSWNGATSLGVANGHWTSIVSLGDGFYLCRVEGINQTTSPSSANNHLVGIYVKPGYSIYVSECYVENTKYCSYIGTDNEEMIMYDCSGFSNNGLVNDIINWSDDTPRYSGSYIPTAASSYISTTLNTSGYANSYTFSYWAKISDMSGKMVWGFGNGNRLNVYPTGSAFCWNTGDGGNNPFKNNGMNVSFSSYNGSWHHYTITGDGTTTTLYIDGEKKGISSTYKSITGTQLYISGWDTGTSYKWINGNISDFRIYATCLSDEDIKELYQVSASVGKTEILSCYEFFDNSNNEITKNGIISFSGLYESDDISSVEIGKNLIQANDFIEL